MFSLSITECTRRIERNSLIGVMSAHAAHVFTCRDITEYSKLGLHDSCRPIVYYIYYSIMGSLRKSYTHSTCTMVVA